MVRRSIHIAAQFLIVLMLGTLVALAGLAWRLTAGPISVAYLTPYFEEALSAIDGAYAVRIDDTILDWSDSARTLNVKLLGARVLDSEKAVLLQTSELYVSLSAIALLRGELAPSSLSLSSPSLRITRTETGEFTLGAEGDSLVGREGSVSTLAEIFTEHSAGRALGYLQRLNILDAELTIDDRLLGIQWSAPDANISIERTRSGISGVTDLDLKVDGQIASIQVNADYHLQSGDLVVSVGFAELRPKALASVTERLAFLDAIDVPLGGTVSVEIARTGEVASAEFNLIGGPGRIVSSTPQALDVAVESSRVRGTYTVADGIVKVDAFDLSFGEAGSLTVPSPIDHTFPVRKFTAQGSWSIPNGHIDIPAFKLALDRPVVEGSLTAHRSTDAFDFDGAVSGSGFAFDDVDKYWPAAVAGNPRAWITKHVLGGRIGNLATKFSARWSPVAGFDLAAINGTIAGDDLVIDYLPPLPKVVNAATTATFDREKFDFTVLAGEAAGLVVRSGRIVISDLEKVDQWTDIDLRIVGPLKAALSTLDSKPFRFAQAVGLSPDSATGDTSTRLKLRFIAERRLQFDEIKVSAESVIKGAGLAGVAFGLDLADGELMLTIDGAGMDVKGVAVLGGLPSDIQWRQNFSKKAAFASRYRVKSTADAAVWREKIGAGATLLGPDFVSGPIGADVVATMKDDGRGTVTAEIALDRSRLAFAPLGLEKRAGQSARAALELTLNRGRVTALPKITLSGEDIDVSASAEFGPDGTFGSARVDRLAGGATDVAGTVRWQDDKWVLDVRGRQLDLKHYMEDETPEDPNAERGAALAIDVNVGAVRLYEDRFLDAVAGHVDFDGLVVRQAGLNGTLRDGGTLKIAIAPDGANRNLSITSDNAGGVLRAFDINENVVGGRLDLVGTYSGMAPGACLGGRVAIDDYRVRNAPILARLLNVASVVGLLDALGGEGIKFDTLRVPFARKDGVTRFENAKASGISIGLTASGWTNSRDDTIEVEGSIIPANVLNGVLGKIPLVGGLFGGEGGIFAINYKVSGSEKEPEVSANPLTVLTPGFTRNIFNLFESKDEETPLGCPKAP